MRAAGKVHQRVAKTIEETITLTLWATNAQDQPLATAARRPA
jgi:hypothetical protein